MYLATEQTNQTTPAPRVTRRNAKSPYLERIPLKKLNELWFGPRFTLRSVWRGIYSREFYVDRGNEDIASFLRWAEGEELLKFDVLKASA